MEFSLTQIVDRPRAGRQFFEEVIRDNLCHAEIMRAAWLPKNACSPSYLFRPLKRPNMLTSAPEVADYPLG
jgi:hypothetical protein